MLIASKFYCHYIWLSLITLQLSVFSESRLTRKTPPAYEDGVYMMAGRDRPSPRKLSQALMKGQDGIGSIRNRTALLAFFGQVRYAQCITSTTQN